VIRGGGTIFGPHEVDVTYEIGLVSKVRIEFEEMLFTEVNFMIL